MTQGAAFELHSPGLIARLSPQGGALLGLWLGDRTEPEQALLRPAASDDSRVTDTAGFPLVPFGNRLGGNGFSCGGTDFTLRANSPDDPLYIHGDGWLGRWEIVEREDNRAGLSYRHAGDNGPYRYLARQYFQLDADRLSLRLSVTNEGKMPLPFGLGWHPYFRRDAETVLQFPAETIRAEAQGSLPGPAQPIDGAFDFRQARTFPELRLNNGFSGWDGKATISWPRRGVAIDMLAEPIFRHVFVYAPEDADFFCFEPMSHMADDHHRDGFGDLAMLAPGESLEGSISLIIRSSADN